MVDKKVVLIFIFQSLFLISSTYEEILLLRTIVSLADALNYMNSQIGNINLDGVLGIRMVDDQFQVLLNFPIKDKYVKFLPWIANLQRKAEYIANKGELFARNTDPQYYHDIGNIIKNGMWMLSYQNRNTSSNYRWKYGHEYLFHENKSDKCLAEIIGKEKENLCPCAISENCWRHMTRFYQEGYIMTHEVIYLQLAEMCKCERQMDHFIAKYNQIGLNFLHDVFCSNILKHAEMIFNSTNNIRHDLFMEQIGICGMIGYKDFYNLEWLESILSWQQPNGCYTNYPLISRSGSRTKREEKTLEDGCLSHKTSVALISLAVNVRFILTS